MLNHRDDCPEPVIDHFAGDRGDNMVKCRRCRAMAVDDGTGSDAPRTPARTAARRNFTVPPCPVGQRFGDQWPTHRGKHRHTSTRGSK